MKYLDNCLRQSRYPEGTDSEGENGKACFHLGGTSIPSQGFIGWGTPGFRRVTLHISYLNSINYCMNISKSCKDSFNYEYQHVKAPVL